MSVKSRFMDPFSPNLPVTDPNRFAGRREQVDEVVDALFQISQGNPKHTVITGDRGIGKSSLLFQTQSMAGGNGTLIDRLGIDPGVPAFNFVTFWHDADHDQSPVDILTALLRAGENRLVKFLKGAQINLDLGGWVQLSKAQPEERTVAILAEEFCKRLEKAYDSAVERDRSIHGLLLFIDELDRVDPKSGMASFLKLAAERFNRDGYGRIAFVCAGITGALQSLGQDHGSIFRTFRDIPIPRMEPHETLEILNQGFSSVGVTYEAEVIASVHAYSAGFPEPVHLFGSELLSVRNGDHLDMHDFEKAKEKIVTDVRKNVLKGMLVKAGYGKYQKILRSMASHKKAEVPVRYISKDINLEQNQFSTNLSNLRKRGIIEYVDRGVYRIVDPLLKEYINRFGIIGTGEESDDDTCE